MIFLRDKSEKVLKAYTANGINTDAHVYHESWSGVIRALIQRKLTKTGPRKTNDLVTRALEQLEEDEMEFENWFSKASWQCHHIFIAMDKVNYYVRGLEPSYCEEMLKEFKNFPPNVYANCKDITWIAAGKGRPASVDGLPTATEVDVY